MRALFAAVWLTILSLPAYAETQPLPEPDTLALIGLAGGLAVFLRSRRKK